MLLIRSGKVQLLLNGGMQFDIYEGVTPFCRQEAAAIVMEGKGKSRRAEEVLFLGEISRFNPNQFRGCLFGMLQVL